MAFTGAERVQIREALGYADTPLYPNSSLESTMSAVSVDGETRIRGFLTRLTAIDAAIATASETNAQVAKVDDVELNAEKQLELLNREGDKLCERIAIILGFKRAASPYMPQAGSSLILP